MILRALRLLSFRGHAETELHLTPKINLLYGPNGAGKTNILEAVHYLCLTKSFVTAQDGYVLRKGASFFEVEGLFEGVQRPELRVRLVYVPEEGKKVFINRAPLERLSQLVGLLPVVVFSPEDHALTAGGPDERRRFLNNILSQARPVYLDDLLKYRRALRQRNELLSHYRQGRAGAHHRALLDSWSEELVVLGSRILAGRLRFIEAFSGFLEEAYLQIAHVAERPSMAYAPMAGVESEADEAAVAEAYRRQLARVARRERELGRTLVGPHLDELVFRLDDLEVRRYASQGQHRTFGMALKLAQYFYLKDRLDEPPLLLLDDIFGTLDADRAGTFLGLLQRDVVGQSLLTAAQRTAFEPAVSFHEPVHQACRVVAGQVQADAAAPYG